MKTTIPLLLIALFCSIIPESYSQTSTGNSNTSFSGSISIFPNEYSMINQQTGNRLVINSSTNESSEKGLYYAYFVYSSNFGIVKAGKYKIRILKHIGNRMQENVFEVKVHQDVPRFYEIIALKKGVYSIRVYDENDVLLSASNYFNITSDPNLDNNREIKHETISAGN